MNYNEFIVNLNQQKRINLLSFKKKRVIFDERKKTFFVGNKKEEEKLTHFYFIVKKLSFSTTFVRAES